MFVTASICEETCSVRDVLDGIVAMMRPYRRSDTVELRVEIDAEVPNLVKIDRVWLQ